MSTKELKLQKARNLLRMSSIISKNKCSNVFSIDSKRLAFHCDSRDINLSYNCNKCHINALGTLIEVVDLYGVCLDEDGIYASFTQR